MTGFFEDHACVVQPVSGENDFGKDLYVDLTRGSVVTGISFAVQVKTGVSFRAASGYRIPIKQHLECWSKSTIPILGIVHDPTSNASFWVNITSHLRARDDDDAYVPVPQENRLSADALPSIEASVNEAARSLAGRHPLVGIWSDSDMEVEQSIWDCFALGRHDARVLLGLRAALPLLRDDVLPQAIRVLAAMTAHPDILRTEDTWVGEPVTRRVRLAYRWTVQEIVRMTRAPDDWERGTLGQDVLMLLAADPDAAVKTLAAMRSDHGDDDNLSWMLFCLFLHFSRHDSAEELAPYLDEFPTIRQNKVLAEVLDLIDEFGFLPIAD